MSNKTNTVLYTGVTNNLVRRVYEHREGINKGFTNRYCVKKLVYYEEINNINSAIAREKQIKGWIRKKKNLLVEQKNPTWDDLSLEFDF